MTRLPSILSCLIVFVVLLVGGAGTELLVAQKSARQQQQAVQVALQRLYGLRARIETELSASLYLASGVEASIRASRGVLKDEEIRRVLAILYARSHSIRNIGIAPGNRIAFIHPVSGNERALGLYYPDNPQQWPSIEKVIRQRASFLAGPIRLVQGGEGLIYRVPVFLDDGSYWGLISTVIDVDKLWQRSGLTELPAGRISILGKDAEGRSGGLVFGVAPGQDAANLISIDIAVPGGNWRLQEHLALTGEGLSGAAGVRVAGWLLTFLASIGVLYLLVNAQRLRRLNAALEVSRDAAEAANRTRASFLAVMSHEVRTPLNGVMGMTQLLLASGLNPSQSDYARTARSSAESLVAIMDNILDYTLIDTGALKLKDEAFELLPLIEDVAEPFALQAHGKGLEFSWAISPALPERVTADSVRIGQVLGQVLSNAVKFTTSGAVVLSVTPDEIRSDCLLCIVRDTGIGIDAKDQKTLFEPFSQVDSSSTRRFGGTGIGLSLCYHLLKLMGGSIRVDSELGQGTSVYLQIPLKSPQGRVDALPCASLQDAFVMLVSPGSSVRTSLEPWLNAWGARLVLASDGQEALAELNCLAATSLVPKLVVMDQVDMPGGESLLAHLEGDERLQGCACVRLLAPGCLFESATDASRGRFALLSKPVRPASLARLICGLLEPGCLEQGASVPVVLPETAAPRILLVEDNIINQKVALAMLGMFNVRVDAAMNGREAVSALSQEDFDLVLMDLQMPEMDGLEATRVIRDPASSVRQHTIPVIALTANALESHRQECFAVGMNDYISKPLEQDRLIEVLGRFLPGLGKTEA